MLLLDGWSGWVYISQTLPLLTDLQGCQSFSLPSGETCLQVSWQLLEDPCRQAVFGWPLSVRVPSPGLSATSVWSLVSVMCARSISICCVFSLQSLVNVAGLVRPVYIQNSSKAGNVWDESSWLHIGSFVNCCVSLRRHVISGWRKTIFTSLLFPLADDTAVKMSNLILLVHISRPIRGAWH